MPEEENQNEQEQSSETSEEGTGGSATTEEKSKEQEQGQTKPPWGSDDEFNPEKAWKLIQNLRGDVEELKPKAAKLRELEDAEKTEAQRLKDQLEAEQASNATSKTEVAKLKAAIKHGLSEEDLELLSGTPEEIEQRAERLAARLAGTSNEEEQEGGTGRRPKERLRPGASPSTEPEETDPRKLAAGLPRHY